jgi:hypothetical protein
MVLADQDVGGVTEQLDRLGQVARPDARVARHRTAQRDEVV